MRILVQSWLKNGMDAPAPEMAKTIVEFMREEVGGGVKTVSAGIRWRRKLRSQSDRYGKAALQAI
jgi:hypothetical protein